MNKKGQQYDWDIVNGRDLYEERLSITLFSCLELQYLCYDKGLSARHYDQEESEDDDDDDDDNDSWESVEEEEEEVEVQEERQWDALPDIALLNIFCNTELKDRLESIPLVCKSWKYVTDDPRCWSSMIPDSVSPEDAFIKKKGDYSFPYYFLPFDYNRRRCIHQKDFLVGISRLFKEEEEEEEDLDDEEFEEEEEVSVGLTRLRTLIKKSGGGAAITSLYLDPFTTCRSFRYGIDESYDEILRLIARRCPNLKHISFHSNHHTSTEAVLRLFNRCKKLELIELFYHRSRFYHRGESEDEQVLPELLSCLNNLRGFRITCDTSIAVVIATHLPQLKLLSLVTTSLTSKDMSIILVSCLELQYLYVYDNRPMLENCHDDILHQASSQIPEFYYEYYELPPSSPGNSYSPERYGGYHSDNWGDWDEDELNYCFDDDDDYFCIDYYDDILQQRKEKKEHHYILKI